jgi:DNA-binding transcriptional LysR family regulator
VDAVSAELAELKDLRTGRVRIAAFPSASATIIPEFLIKMAVSFQGISVSFTEAEPPEAVSLLRAGAVDMVLSFSYPGAIEDPHRISTNGLAVANLFEDEVLIALPEAAWGHEQGAISLGQLSQEQWITGCERCQTYLLNVCADAGFTASVRMQTENYSALLTMVAGGLGVGLVTRLALNSVSVPDGVVLRRFSAIGPRRIHLVTTQRARQMPSLAATISAILSLDGTQWGLTPMQKRRSVSSRPPLSGD